MSDQHPTRGSSPRTVGIARHGRLRTANPWLAVLKFVGVAVAVLAVSAASIVAIDGYRTIAGVKTIVLPGQTEGPPPNIAAMEGGFNILIVGSDTRKDQGGIGGKTGGELNDVTMLLHVSGDNTNAVAVSIPRDMVVPIPPCPRLDGSGNYPRMSGQPINVTLSYGGLACTVVTVQELTGLHIDFAGLITFTGVIEMTNAVGGVPVCIAEPIHDKFSGFNSEAGVVELAGEPALQFLRSRHGVGDGSDLTRISSQQVYLSSLVRTLQSSDTLNDFPKLYQIANAALRNMTLTSNLTQLDTMVAIAQALKNIPPENVTFVQYPGSTGQPGLYLGKVKPNATIANALFAKIKADEPFALAKVGDGQGSVVDPNATVAPVDPSATPNPTATPTQAAPVDPNGLEVIAGLKGQTGAQQTCSRAYHG